MVIKCDLILESQSIRYLNNTNVDALFLNWKMVCALTAEHTCAIGNNQFLPTTSTAKVFGTTILRRFSCDSGAGLDSAVTSHT